MQRSAGATSAVRRTLRAARAPRGRHLRTQGADDRVPDHLPDHLPDHVPERALIVVRGAWLAVAALALGLYLAGLGFWLARPDWPCSIPLCPHGPLATRRALAVLHLSLGVVGGYEIAMHLLVVAGYAAMGALLFWRRPRDPLALFVSLTLLVFGAGFFAPELGALAAASPGWWAPVSILRFLGVAALGVLLVVFPDGRFVPRWTLPVAAGWALWLFPSYLFPSSPLDFNTWPAAPSLGVWALFLGAILWAQIYRFRHVSTPAQRQQTKWVVLGMALAALGFFANRVFFFAAAVQAYSPQAALWDLVGRTLIYVGLPLIPLCIAVAILRHHLFDVNLLIQRALVYAALVATLAVLYECGTLVVVNGLLALTGETGLAAEVAVAFVVGALAGPLHRRIERDIARAIYPRKYDAERHIEALSKQLRREWGVVPPSAAWREAFARRLSRTWAAMLRRPAPTSEYVQGRLFP